MRLSRKHSMLMPFHELLNVHATKKSHTLIKEQINEEDSLDKSEVSSEEDKYEVASGVEGTSYCT